MIQLSMDDKTTSACGIFKVTDVDALYVYTSTWINLKYLVFKRSKTQNNRIFH